MGPISLRFILLRAKAPCRRSTPSVGTPDFG